MTKTLDTQSEPHYFFEAGAKGSADEIWQLRALKSWRGVEDGQSYIRFASLTMAEQAASHAPAMERASDNLNNLIDKNRLEEAMHEAERQATANGFLDPLRAEPALFQDGPPDTFRSLREAELDPSPTEAQQFLAGYAGDSAWEKEPEIPPIKPVSPATKRSRDRER